MLCQGVGVLREFFLSAMVALSSASVAPRPQEVGALPASGALVIQFDDGFANWLSDAAPILARQGGKATGFVCDQYVRSGRVSLKDLRELQDRFGWEIGTHTAHHVSAPRIAEKMGAERWADREVRPSLDYFRLAGLKVQSLAFPFNAWTPELAGAVSKAGLVFRDAGLGPLAQGLGANGSFPGVSIDTVKGVSSDTMRSWVDMAAKEGSGLFLYGHRVLPDKSFVEARVVRVEPDRIELENEPKLPEGEPLAVVPDPGKPRSGGSSWLVRSVEGNVVHVEGGDLRPFLSPGGMVLIGPSYGTRASDFEQLLHYAASRKLRFMTVQEFIRERSTSAGAAP